MNDPQRPILNPIPLDQVQVNVPGRVCYTLCPGDWDPIHAEAYERGDLLLELDPGTGQPIAAYQKPTPDVLTADVNALPAPKRPALHQVPFGAATPVEHNVVAMVTMEPGEWDDFLAAAYERGVFLVELDNDGAPLATYQKPGPHPPLTPPAA